MKCDCLFCWYWWNCWSSLFKYSLGEMRWFVVLILVGLLTITVQTFFRWNVTVCFVDMGGIVDHHCLNIFYVRCDCLFCWYWWNWWSSLFKLFFRWEVIVCFVDIGGIVDHHCLNILWVKCDGLLCWYGWNCWP